MFLLGDTNNKQLIIYLKYIIIDFKKEKRDGLQMIQQVQNEIKYNNGNGRAGPNKTKIQ